jgi:hypothetical protein
LAPVNGLGIKTSLRVEKCQGYHYEHAFSYTWNAMKGYHYLMRLAQVPWLLLLSWRLLSLETAKGQRAARHHGEKRKLGQLMRQSWVINQVIVLSENAWIHFRYLSIKSADLTDFCKITTANGSYK